MVENDICVGDVCSFARFEYKMTIFHVQIEKYVNNELGEWNGEKWSPINMGCTNHRLTTERD